MFGWRARIGYINPGVYLYSQEFDAVLPKGVVWAMVSLGVQRLVAGEFDRVIKMYPQAGEMLASREVGFIICAGAPVYFWLGHEKGLKLAKSIQDVTGIPTQWALTATANALGRLSAKKLIVVTPYDKDSNEAHRKGLNELGFDVVNIKGAGFQNNNEFTKLPPYASYRLVKEAVREAPEADAVWIGCPGWPVVSNIDILEKDIGKPVVAEVTCCLWSALAALNIREPIKGYGKLLELL